MKDNHITDIIDNTPFVDLSDSELQTIHAHAATCVDCERAFAAASISSLLIRERTSEAAQHTLNANPFFETRVLAAWREQQAAPGDWSFGDCGVRPARSWHRWRRRPQRSQC